MMSILRMELGPKRASTCKLSPVEGVAAYQLVGEVMAHQGYDAQRV